MSSRWRTMIVALVVILATPLLIYARPSDQPPIPHPLEGREACLACHEAGVGGATQIPTDHVGRPNESCITCHSPTPAEEPSPTRVVPTPIIFPQRGAVNTCLECHRSLGGKHEEITTAWEGGIHSRRGVGCAHCHGGDPGASDMATSMSPEAGYIGVPAKAEIPALCASCHSNVDLMRQYNLPTDQWAKFQESVHGQRLEEGDTKVATCFDCHGGHRMNPANEPSSTVYPTNIPAMCARCHSDAEYMRSYDLPTDQDELYRKSVHGVALLEKQDLRSPNCATCHGKHGAAAPGFTEVANVCGQCHSATQNYYVQGAHARSPQGAVEPPKCVTCHGQHDVPWPTEELFLGDEPRRCGYCHQEGSPEAEIATRMYEALNEAAQSLAEAEEAIERASGSGLIVVAERSRLHEATTSLMEARAAQHDVQLITLTGMTDKALSISQEVKEDAEKAIAQAVIRRRAMVIAVAGIGLTIIALYRIKRELDQEWLSRGS
ncbi:MAG: cytochrome c3 family protein [Anaerolineae bacterium]